MNTKYKIEKKKLYIASVSGGKDSLYMLKLILSHPEMYKLDGVVNFDLEIEYPFTKQVVDYMESQCKKYGIPFYRIKPRKTWKELYDKYGFPTLFFRWCNHEYKLDCKKQLRSMFSEYDIIYYIGLCFDEMKRFKNDIFVDSKYRYPLAEFGIHEIVILKWAKGVQLFNDYYKYNNRCGCMYCPLMARKTMRYLKKFYPEHYIYMMKLARQTEINMFKKYGRKFSVWSSNPKYDTLYMIKRLNK